MRIPRFSDKSKSINHFSLVKFYQLYGCLWILLLIFQIAPALAHNIKASGDVAATFHIEPNHNPQAGETAKAWFALTRKGGKIIPLIECNCQLEINLKPHKEGSPPLLNPPIKSISAEQYQGIPGAEVVFPKAGEYELEFSGTPKNGADFQPFEFSYTVTVRAGTNVPTISPLPKGVNTPQDGDKDKISQSLSQWKIPQLVLVVVLVLGGIGLVVRWLKMGKF